MHGVDGMVGSRTPGVDDLLISALDPNPIHAETARTDYIKAIAGNKPAVLGTGTGTIEKVC